MSKVAGTCFFKIDGTQYNLRGNMKVSIGNVKRESVVGLDRYHGIKEIPEISSIECELTHQPDIDLNVLEQLENRTITVELINGAVATLRNANQVNHIDLTAEDGKFTVKFEGPKGEWQVATV